MNCDSQYFEACLIRAFPECSAWITALRAEDREGFTIIVYDRLMPRVIDILRHPNEPLGERALDFIESMSATSDAYTRSVYFESVLSFLVELPDAQRVICFDRLRPKTRADLDELIERQ